MFIKLLVKLNSIYRYLSTIYLVQIVFFSQFSTRRITNCYLTTFCNFDQDGKKMSPHVEVKVQFCPYPNTKYYIK